MGVAGTGGTGQGTKPAKGKTGGAESRVIPQAEREALHHLPLAVEYIEKHRGKFFTDELGGLHLIVNGMNVPLSLDQSIQQNPFLLQSCNLTSSTSGAKALLMRLHEYGRKKAGEFTLHKFSAMNKKRDAVYVALKDDSSFISVTAEGMKLVPNGEGVWVEHPRVYDAAPLEWTGETSGGGLGHFERLCVVNQSCKQEAMKWFVAMNEGLFPFARDICLERFILMHRGRSQSGKTSGAQRFTKLLGLGEVKGNFSMAAARNQGDIGLFVMDNKEEVNFSQELIDFCLTASTGAEHTRSTKDGRIRSSSRRPVVVITSIEGGFKQEFGLRVVEVEYEIGAGVDTESEEFIKNSSRLKIELEIEARRDEVCSELLLVIQEWLRMRRDGEGIGWRGPDCLTKPSRRNFGEHFEALGDLLGAFAGVSGKGRKWAEGIVKEWEKALTNEDDSPVSEMEYPVLQCFMDGDEDEVEQERAVVGGAHGEVLAMKSIGVLLDKLLMRSQRYHWVAGLKRPEALRARLKAEHFKAFRFMGSGEEGDKGVIKILRRTKSNRPIGIFVADEDKEKVRKGVENYVDPMG